jgi:hypothetical protein
MKHFEDLEHIERREGWLHHGTIAKMYFDNWYGVSVIRWPYSYGWTDGKWEIAILKWTKEKSFLCYDTPITDDVIWHLEAREVSDIMWKVQELPPIE